MDQFRKLFAGLSNRQKIGLLVSLLVVGGGITALLRWQEESDFRPLFKSMSPEDALAILQKLKENGVAYRVAENGSTVMAPSARVAELRLEMAGAGLPKSGRIGFELFDRSNFGATEFTEHVNYRRALEGELERSVMSLAEVEHARVHVTLPKNSVFSEAREPAKASVLVKLKPGQRLGQQSVLAISHLIASAVEGLKPESVSVLDMRGNLLSRPKVQQAGADSPEPSDASLEYRERIERALAAKIAGTIEPLFGAGKFRTGVSVECDFSSGEQSEEIVDPSKSVMLTSQKSEDISSGAIGATGVPGTPSALPRPTSKPGASNSGFSRKTENITFQSSRTMKRVKLPQGTIRRVSVSVLVDHDVQWQGQGANAKRVLTPPPRERLEKVRELIAGVIGFNEQRGDQLIVETLAFDTSQYSEPPAAVPAPPPASAPPPAKYDTLQQLIKKPEYLSIGGAVLLLLLVVIGLLMRRSARRRERRNAATVVALPSLPASTVGDTAGPENALPQGGVESPAALADSDAAPERLLQAPPQVRLETIAASLREGARADSELYARIVRDWLAGQNAQP